MRLEQLLGQPIGQSPKHSQARSFPPCQLSFSAVSNQKSLGARLWEIESGGLQDPGSDAAAACQLWWGAGGTGREGANWRRRCKREGDCLIAGMLKRVARLFLEVLIPAWPEYKGQPKFQA